MRPCPLRAALVVALAVGPVLVAADPQDGRPAPIQLVQSGADGLKGSFPLLVRPSTLAAQIEALAGHPVRVLYARVVGVFNPRAFLVDTSTRLPPVAGHRARVLVLVREGGLSVPASTIVASTVAVVGVARTLLGMQVSREVPWPVELRPEAVERLEVRAAVLATSVTTAEGVDLTTRAEPRP